MMCPNCSSTNVRSNKFYTPEERVKLSVSGHYAGVHGHPYLAAAATLAKLIDRLLPDYKCNSCHKTFYKK